MSGINLSELTLDNVGQWPFPIKVGVVVGFGLLIMGLGYWFIIKANLSNMPPYKRKRLL